MAEKVFPFWVGYFLCSPIRKLWHNPEKILKPYINQGIKVLDIGCAMGFFSLPLAKMAGHNGRVICVDIQQKMIRLLEKRAKKAGLLERIETQVCSENSFGLEKFIGQIDFALAFAVVHEAPDALAFFSQIYRLLKSQGELLMAEPKRRMSKEDFSASIQKAKGIGFDIIDSPRINGCRAVLLQKL